MHALSTDDRAPCATDASWLAENTRGLAAAAAGDWAEAVEAFASAAELASGDRDGDTHDALALVLNNLAQASFRAGRHDDGIRHAQRVCALRTALAGEDAITVARARADLAVMLGAVGRSDEGRALAVRAAAGIERTAGDEDVRLCSVLENAARLAVAAGQLSSAEPLLLRLHALLAVHELPTTAAETLLAHIAQHRQLAVPPRSESVQAAPDASALVVAEPVVAQEIVADPITSEPVASEPVASEPVASEPVGDEPVVAEAVGFEPVVPEAIVTEAIVTEAIVTEAIVTEALVTEAFVTESLGSEPMVVASLVSDVAWGEPATTALAATELTTTEPATTELATTELATTELATTEPTAIELVTMESGTPPSVEPPLVFESPLDAASQRVANIEFDLADDFSSSPVVVADAAKEKDAGALAFADVLEIDDALADDILGNVSFDLIELEPPAAPTRAAAAIDTPVDAPVLDVLGFTVEYGTPTETDYSAPTDAIIAPPPSRRIATPTTAMDVRPTEPHSRMTHASAPSAAAPSHESAHGVADAASSGSSQTSGMAPAPYLKLHQAEDGNRDRRGKLRAGRASAPQSSGGVMMAGAVTATVAAAIGWLIFGGG
jgi:hypothetical protein